MSEALVLDNSILSAFQTAGWFKALEFWRPSKEILTPAIVWEEEFLPYNDVSTAPDWLDIIEVDLSEVHAQAVGQLSRADWAGIGIIEAYDGVAILVTNDYAQKEVAAEQGYETIWGTKFTIETFERCGISIREFERGSPAYIEDTLIGDDVAEALRAAEKVNPED